MSSNARVLPVDIWLSSARLYEITFTVKRKGQPCPPDTKEKESEDGTRTVEVRVPVVAIAVLEALHQAVEVMVEEFNNPSGDSLDEKSDNSDGENSQDESKELSE